MGLASVVLGLAAGMGLSATLGHAEGHGAVMRGVGRVGPNSREKGRQLGHVIGIEGDAMLSQGGLGGIHLAVPPGTLLPFAL